MKLRQVVIAITAAGYFASASAGVVDWLLGNDTPAPASRFSAPKLDDDAPSAEQQQKRQQKLLEQLQRRYGSDAVLNRANVHRDRNAKVPFVRDNKLGNGEYSWIIQLSDAPVASYKGGVSGYAAVASQKAGSKVNLKSGAAKQYASYLSSQQAKVLNAARSIKANAAPFHYYKNAFNGMAMQLTQAQAEAVAQLPGVRNVTRAKMLQLNTDVGPQHIGAGPVWDGTGAGVTAANLGEGIIAGILDTGINSDHPSFAAIGGDGYEHVNPFGAGVYKGDCAKPEFAALCNDKLIGIHSYPEITNAYKDWELLDPNTNAPKRPANGEDYHGHGSHTASTVAGNVLNSVPLIWPTLGETGDGFAVAHNFDRISGVAPHANIISYQVCHYGNQGDKFAGCPESATLKAIDDAIADGVDVINYSIGGSENNPWTSPTELAFLAAREAGISVAASAGNSGSFGGDHASPWLASIAATTHGRSIDIATKKLTGFAGGDTPPGWDLSGNSLSGGITAPVVAAANFDNPNSAEADDLCEQPYPAGTFTGEIVVCRRGINARVEKGANVLAGGAGGMVLYDDPNASPDTPLVYDIGHDPHVLPAIHVDSYSGQTIIDWLAAGSGHQATITDANLTVANDPANADQVAEFSSRGPSQTVNNVMFPHVGGPGVDVYAAYADEHPFSTTPVSGDYTVMSGTSMASPHVAGAMVLVRNSQPGWTAAEVQSALMLTAVPARLPTLWGAPPPASYFDAGSGVVRVDQAINASLIMDETPGNFRAANPLEGGNVSNLNLPFLVNRECRDRCTWVRTFKATRDGSWTVNAEDVTTLGAPMLRLEASPASFSLRAGETQKIMVRAVTDDVSVTGSNGPFDSSTEDRFGRVMLTPSDNSPTLKLPVIVRWGSGGLPNEISADAHRTTGRNIAQPVMLPEFSQLTTRQYGLVKANQHTVHLSMPQFYADDGGEALANDPGRHVQLIDVPAGTKRLVVDVYPNPVVQGAVASLDMGRDLNDNGLVEWDQEAICYSVWMMRNFCSINNPEPGRYWIVVSNEKWVNTWAGEVDTADPIAFAWAVVGENDADNLTVLAPSSSDGRAPVELAVQWDLPTLAQGELYYGAFDVGVDANNAGNLGTVGVRVEHIGPDVSFTASKQGAKVGDVVDYTVQLDPNLFGQDRDFALKVNLPNGLKLMPGSAKLVGNNQGGNALSSTDQTVSVTGVQEATRNTGREYLFTTSDNDPNCRIPGADDGLYLDLRVFGFGPLAGISGQSNNVAFFDAKQFWGEDAHVPLYGVKREHTPGAIGISPAGFVQYDNMYSFFPLHFPLEEQFYPDMLVAPYWRGDTGSDGTWFSGVMVARDSEAGLQYFQWVGVKEVETLWNGFEADPDARYNYETVVSEKLDFEPGAYEVYFAYSDMQGDYTEGSVGTHGYYGPRGPFGPELGWIGDSYGYDNLNDKIRKNLVICGDYQGPERSAITLKFAAKVGASAVGSTLPVTLSSEYGDAETITLNKPLTVVGNIIVAGMPDVSTMQNEAIEDLTVLYVDQMPTANRISVTGEHVTATIHGNDAGSTFDLLPETNWHGDTEVTVTVYDASQPNDKHSQTFTLSVLPVTTAKLANAAISVAAGSNVNLDARPSWGRSGRALSYQWQQTAGSSLPLADAGAALVVLNAVPAGSYEFTVTVSDGISDDRATVKLTVSAPGSAGGNDSGGGGGGTPIVVLAGLLTLLAMRRQRREH